MFLADGGISVLGVHLGDYSGEALSALFIILVFLGVWRPRSEVKQWQASAMKSAEQVDRLTKAFEDLVEAVKQPPQQQGQQLQGHNGEVQSPASKGQAP